MNEIVNTFLLAGDKFMPQMHLIQIEFTYSACGPFTRNKQRIQRFMETGDTNQGSEFSKKSFKKWLKDNKIDKTITRIYSKLERRNFCH